MTFPFLLGEGEQRTEALSDLHSSHPFLARDPQYYRPDRGLVHACNVALLLGQPLLITGEPGTGKTQFANYVAWELGLEPLYKFETKSDSAAKDLFYTYDTLKRFHDAQIKRMSDNPIDYLSYQALGKAILFTNPIEEVQAFLPGGYRHYEPRRSIVLIDEVDKAPRDFPNDILNELELLYFRIPELTPTISEAGSRDIPTVEMDETLRPLVIFTSNSEKDLPDAFLRRCIFYHIEFPDEATLKEILHRRVSSSGDPFGFIDEAISFFTALRSLDADLTKPPSTAELLQWFALMHQLSRDQPVSPTHLKSLFQRGLNCLIKTADDMKKATDILEQWEPQTNPQP